MKEKNSDDLHGAKVALERRRREQTGKWPLVTETSDENICRQTVSRAQASKQGDAGKMLKVQLLPGAGHWEGGREGGAVWCTWRASGCHSLHTHFKTSAGCARQQQPRPRPRLCLAPDAFDEQSIGSGHQPNVELRMRRQSG